jgi:TolB-like protein
LFAELKRRNVFRVGLAYLVAAWLLVQVADLLLDIIGAPPVVLRSVVVLLALGFILAVIFAWVYELTPEGIRKASEIETTTSITHETGRKLDVVTIALVIVAVILVALARYFPARQDAATEPESAAATETMAGERSATGEQGAAATGQPATSIAVLPFANRSNQQDDLYFTDGIHDDLLTQLAKIHDLTVISRTSVMQYRDSPKNLRQIGAELKVGTILEGGVQKVGNRVRINAQLLDVSRDRHLWAETFDRELTVENVFELQSEIARRIVEAIAVRLSPEEERRLAEIPTQNLEAYEAYSRARAVFFGANYTRSQEEAAEPFLERAIELDPNYVDAHVLLSAIYAQRYWRGVDTSGALLETYRRTLDRASALNPASPDVLRAQANYAYRVNNDYRSSLELLERAVQAAPGNVDIHGDIASTLRRLGRWEDAIASFRRGLELDPASSYYRALMLETMVSIWKWQDVLDNSVPLEEANPDELDSQVCRGVALMNLTGDLEPLQRVFERMNAVASTWYLTHSAYVHMLRRDPDGAIEVLNGPAWGELAQQQVGKAVQLAQLADAWLLKGDEARALDLYAQVVADQEIVMSSSLQTQIYGGTTIAVALARLGRRDEALTLANQLVRENPYEKDAMVAATPLFKRALVKGLIGDTDGAIADLQVALKMPTAIGVTAWDLHYDPNWDVLRKDPRFVRLATPNVSDSPQE